MPADRRLMKSDTTSSRPTLCPAGRQRNPSVPETTLGTTSGSVFVTNDQRTTQMERRPVWSSEGTKDVTGCAKRDVNEVLTD